VYIEPLNKKKEFPGAVFLQPLERQGKASIKAAKSSCVVVGVKPFGIAKIPGQGGAAGEPGCLIAVLFQHLGQS